MADTTQNTIPAIQAKIEENYRAATNSQFLWGRDIPCWAVAIHSNPRSMTKKEFKKAYSSMRKYYREQDSN